MGRLSVGHSGHIRGALVTDNVLIVDFGSQVTQLIARRVREAGVYSEIVPFNRAEEALARLEPKAIILSGGPASVTAEGSPRAPQGVFESGLPILVHLLRPADHRRAARRHGRGRARGRVRPRRGGDQGEERAVRRHLGGRQALSGVDEPRRSRHTAARGLHGQGDERERALCRGERRRAAHLHDHVPPRGGAHAGRREAVVEFRAQDRRLEERLDDGALPHLRDRQDPQSGRQGARHLRAVGRRRLALSPRC